MAVQTIVSDMSLRLVLHSGQDGNGKDILKNKQFKNVKPDADVNKIHEVAIALTSLQKSTLNAVQLISTTDVSNQ